MPKQLNSDYNEVAIPFNKMSFTPDVPSNQLGPNEYNDGLNVESDVRGIRSTAGDQEFLTEVPGTPTYISSGFRRNGEFWFIVATVEGYWYATNGTTVDWYVINPGGTPFTGYAQNTNITEAWNGTVPFFNDGLNPPMFLPDEDGAVLIAYSNSQPLTIANITVASPSTLTAHLTETTEGFLPGEYITITGVNAYFNGTFQIVSVPDILSITYTATAGASYPLGTYGTLSPAYSWNYNPNWKSVTAGFMRLYSTPNVGSILVAGDLTATLLDDSTVRYPVTVQWSQNFGLNQAPLTWEPTITNIANQLEVPLRGVALDAFPCNGNFFLCSYWDTVVFSPLNYSTTSAPILGVRLFNQGRGLLSANCWGNTDKNIYGVDARDIWVFNGTDFQGLGNQRVKNWFYDQLDPQYYDRVFMQVNTQKNQIEIYYPDSNATNGVPNKMLAYRYELDLWNSPREVDSATMSCESPIWIQDSITSDWSANLGSRTVVYARGITDNKIVQKDIGYTKADGSAISSRFRRDNVKMLKDYSGKLMVHRILPEAVNLGAEPFDETNMIQLPESTGNLSVKVQGANSVGQVPQSSVEHTMTLNTDNPWLQIDQNAFRINSIELSNTSSTDVWMCNVVTWQFTQVEDDR